jgi:uncharacterized protein (TIGR02594 family)
MTTDLDIVPPWLAWARKELGIHETPGPHSTARILEYRTIAGCDLKGDDGDVAWCKIFVTAAFLSCDIPIQRNWMARSIESDSHFVRLIGPAMGAVASYWRGNRRAGLGHIGFYVGETGSLVLTLGGNESDAVRKAFYPKAGNSMGLIGYYWPKSVPVPRCGAIRVADDGSSIASAT